MNFDHLNIRLYRPHGSFQKVIDLIQDERILAAINGRANLPEIKSAVEEYRVDFRATIDNDALVTARSMALGRLCAISSVMNVVEGNYALAKENAATACVWNCDASDWDEGEKFGASQL